LWKRTDGSTRVYVDALYGSGLTDATHLMVPLFPTAERSRLLFGESGVMKASRSWERAFESPIDVVNITDQMYQLRTGLA
jgi:hypothetical protein